MNCGQLCAEASAAEPPLWEGYITHHPLPPCSALRSLMFLAVRAAGRAACLQETHRAAILPPTEESQPPPGWAPGSAFPGRNNAFIQRDAEPGAGATLEARAGLTPRQTVWSQSRAPDPFPQRGRPRVPLAPPVRPGHLLPKEQGAGQMAGSVPPRSSAAREAFIPFSPPRGLPLQPRWGLG